MQVQNKFDGVKVFSATQYKDREVLGERVTEWLASHPMYRPVDVVVTQSSDASFHMIAISVFYVVVVVYLTDMGIAHTHPAARGRIRKRATYIAHVVDRLDGGAWAITMRDYGSGRISCLIPEMTPPVRK